MINCYIDDREHDRGLRAMKYYLDNGFGIKHTELLYGDFVFKDTETGLTVAFEYKTLEDFINSINDNRVFNQALNQSNNFDYHFVIVVGTDADKTRVIRDNERYTGNYVTNEQFYGAYASLVNITSLIQVPREAVAFMVMGKVAEKCCNLKPVVKRFRKSRGTPAFRLLNNNVNGVGYKTAEMICRDLDLKSINDVLSLNREKLVGIKGIGVKKADNILEQLHGEFF